VVKQETGVRAGIIERFSNLEKNPKGPERENVALTKRTSAQREKEET